MKPSSAEHKGIINSCCYVKLKKPFLAHTKLKLYVKLTIYWSRISVSKHNQATYLRDEFSDPPLWSPLSPLSWLEDLLAALLELPLRLSASLGGSLVTWQPVMKLRLWGLNTIPSVSAMKSLSLISFFWKITDKKLGSYVM